MGRTRRVREHYLMGLVLAAALGAGGCPQSESGPTVAAGLPPPAVEPEAVCVEQLDTWVSLTGSGMSPLPVDLLGGDPHLELPAVELIRALDIDGTPAGDPPVLVPDEPFADSLVRWISQEEMQLQVTPGLGLATGLFTIRVTNATGDSAEWPEALLGVPPPQITGTSPDLLCAEHATSFVLSGDFLLTIGDAMPTVVATPLAGGEALELTPASLSTCRALPGSAGVEACTEATVELAAGTLTAGDPATGYLISVTNPDPVACHTSNELALTMVPAPTVVGLSPDVVCNAQGDTTVTVTGTGFLTIDGTGPTLTLTGSTTETLTATASDCVPVVGPAATVESCTTITATVPEGFLEPGAYTVTVTNPPPANCSASNEIVITVVPPPTITGVTPATVCAGGGRLTITGTGFRDGITVSVGSTPATNVDVISDTTMEASFGFINEPAGGPYDVTVQNVDGCSAVLSPGVSVVAGPQLYFADPPVAYNGMDTQITLYGSGIGGSVVSIGIRLSGTTDVPTALVFTLVPGKSNQVQAVIPAGTAPGTYDVILDDSSNCDAILLEGIQVVEAETLELTMIVPNFGHTASDTAVTILADPAVGGGFQPVPRLYLNPVNGSQAAALRSVSYIDTDRITAVVPPLPVDTYDVIAVNPDGGLGVLPAAFTVTQEPPPRITGISPGSIANVAPADVTVTGVNFRSPSGLLQCLDFNTDALVELTPIASAPSTTSVVLTVDGTSFSKGAVCVVRVINGDDGSYDDFSSLVITNLSENLSEFHGGMAMTTPRRALASVANAATPAARFIYAMGGDQGTTDTALASIDVAPVDIFGRPGEFFAQREELGMARSYHSAAILGRCIYVAGGINDTTILNSVERACVLDPEERPEVTDLELDPVTSGGVGPGLWYYQVSAMLPASHPFNPDGETLPSEPFPVLLPEILGHQVDITIHFSAVAGAVGYRIYRSPAADAAVNALELLAEVPDTTPYTDTGGAVIGGSPQRLGATGTWQTLAATLFTPRQGPGVTIAPDPGDATGTLFNLYVMGGLSDTGVALRSYERLPITIELDGSQTAAGAFTEVADAIPTGRWQLGLFQMGHETASYITAPTRYLYAGGGVAANGNNMEGEVDALEVLSGGALGTSVSVDPMQPFMAGYGFAGVNNFLFAFGGAQAHPSDLVSAVKICLEAYGVQCPTGPPALENWDNPNLHMTVPRYLVGSAMVSGFIYILGGQTDVDAATNSTEYTIW